jgi:hypothetical protein
MLIKELLFNYFNFSYCSLLNIFTESNNVNGSQPNIGFYEYITRTIYFVMYKMYMFKLSCINEAKEQMITYMPKLMILNQIGVWNTILAISLILIASVLYNTPDEIYQIKNLKKRYIPKSRRRRVTKLNKIVAQMCARVGKYLDQKVSNIKTNHKHRLNTNRQKRKYYNLRNKARKMSRWHSSKGKTLTIMAAIAMSTEASTKYGQKMIRFDTDSKTIGVDNRCSACISCDETDFISDLRPSNRSIKGFGGARHQGTVMVGTLLWKWCDDEGKVHSFTIPNSYYVPDGKARLLSPQHWAKTQKDKMEWGTCEHTSPSKCVLYWKQKQYSLTIPLSKSTNVATYPLAPGYKRYDMYCHEVGITTTADDADMVRDITVPIISDDEDDNSVTPNAGTGSEEQRDERWAPKDPQTCAFNINGPIINQDNITSTSRENTSHQAQDTMSKDMQDMMKLHQRLGHISFHKIRELAKQGALPAKFAKCDIPVCTSCMYAKMTKRPWKGKNRNNYSPRPTPKPGEVVSVDQMVSTTHGLVAQMTGILTTARYKYATVYVDQGSRLGYTYLQKSATAEETIKGKIAFELFARSHGITIKGYHADNGIFRANAWVQHCLTADQNLSFAGVNAHHQNGVAERRIRELQELARTMLIHAARRWPACITANLWPYAVRMANDIFNHCPNLKDDKSRSPIQIFGNTQVVMNPKHFQPFGCPVFILDNALQHNSPFNKWKERSRVGIYLGKSPAHSRNVALVLDRTTGLVSPQFHVKFDHSFHTVMQDELDSRWQDRAGFIKQEPKEKPKAKKQKSKRTKKPKHSKRAGARGPTQPHIPNEERESSNEAITGAPRQEGAMPAQEGAGPVRDQINLGKRTQDQLQLPLETRTPTTYNLRKRSKSTETQRQVNFIQNEGLKTQVGSGGMAKPLVTAYNSSQIQNQPHLISMVTEVSQSTRDDIEGEILCLEAMFPDNKEQYQMVRMERDPLYAYKATADPDTMYMHEAMREHDADKFKEAMLKEVQDQMGNGNFTLIPKSQVPKGKIILPAVWQMKRKRDIKTRKVKKYKARLNIDGSRMIKGEHYDQTYAPVASWKFIRLLLTLVVKYGWYSRQLDYVLAFPQAPVEKEIYMKIPKGFQLDLPEGKAEHVLKIHRNIYGQKQAGRVWNQYLTSKLKNELGFKQSKIDECIFYRGKTLYMLYTDDSLLAGPDNNEIEQIIKDLKKAQLNITDEGDIQDFLGVNIDSRPDGSVHLTQPHLIDQILKDLKFPDEGKGKVLDKHTPAKSSEVLKRDKDGPDYDKSFNYRSIIGKLNYLEKGTRSDIAYIAHQCARFTEEPKESHAKALKWLARYLRTTRDKGLILKPQKNRGLEVYVDADFSGNWDPTAPHSDRDTARSRHGYIVMYEGCPMIWKSQLQTEIALSSTESEYIGISYAMREVIPIMELLKEMKRENFPIFKTKPKLHCKVFEDNSGALEMAKTHKYRPRTKHLNVKLHHFRDYVTRGEISIHKIDTKEQLADYLTKPVSQEILQYLRPKVMGW